MEICRRQWRIQNQTRSDLGSRAIRGQTGGWKLPLDTFIQTMRSRVGYEFTTQKDSMQRFYVLVGCFPKQWVRNNWLPLSQSVYRMFQLWWNRTNTEVLRPKSCWKIQNQLGFLRSRNLTGPTKSSENLKREPVSSSRETTALPWHISRRRRAFSLFLEPPGAQKCISFI